MASGKHTISETQSICFITGKNSAALPKGKCFLKEDHFMGISLFSFLSERVVLFQPRSFDKRHFISRPRSFLIKAS